MVRRLRTGNEERSELGLGPLPNFPRFPYVDMPADRPGNHPLEAMDFYLDGVKISDDNVRYDRGLESIRVDLEPCDHHRELTIYHKQYRYSSDGINYKKYVYHIHTSMEELVFAVNTHISGSFEFSMEIPAAVPEPPTEGSDFEL